MLACILLSALGAGLFLASLVRTLRANSGIRVPYLRNAATVPPGAIAMRAFGAGLIAFGGVMLGTTAWYLAFVVLLLVALVTLVLIVVHNGGVARRSNV